MMQAVLDISRRLEDAGIPEARLKAELLVAEALGINRLLLSDASDASDLSDQIGPSADRLAAGEPIQYVLGYTSFLGHRIACDRRALIPRPETEELVEFVLSSIPDIFDDGRHRKCQGLFRVVDIGTGTGCIAIALKLARPDAHVVATDISPDALALACENAAALGAEISFVEADLIPEDQGPFDLLVANVPYVPSDDMPGLDRSVRDFEPRQALDGGFQGLEVLRRLVSKGWKKLNPGGSLFLEIGTGQGEAVKKLLEDSGFVEIQVRKDLCGHDRIVSALTPET
ncbi:MAG TPA: peptide chain release factor N(5)-glutamine methyltransferase [Kiritimatiellia bacterium]|jgi:release factor glutamine methyltransferase